MRPIKTLFENVYVLETPRFGDERGSFAVPFEAVSAAAAGLPTSFVQDNHSISTPRGTLRGLHLQLPPHGQGKLVRVLRGSIVDVVIDLRPGSVSHGQHARIELDAITGNQLWVPAGFAHGFCTLEPDTEVFYKVDAPYQPDAEWSLAWDDPTLAIDWPVGPDEVVLSGKDAAGRTLSDTVAAIEEATK